MASRRRKLLIVGTLGVLALASSAIVDFIIRPAPRIIWNASQSAPLGLWWIDATTVVQPGEMVLAHTPDPVRMLAAIRGYVPANVPLLKRVVAADGDTVCAIGTRVLKNGRLVATRQFTDRSGRLLPWWSGCETLAGGRVFLLMDTADSFDGRYFGSVDRARIIGKATPLWLR